MAAQSTLSLVFRAQDNASGTIDAIGKQVKKLPEGFSKASAALSVLEGGLSKTGSQAAHAVGKLSGLASLISTGGPIGIGIAAVSAATWVGVQAWGAYTAATSYAEKASADMTSATAKSTGRLKDQVQEIENAEKALRALGKTTTDAGVDELQRGIEESIDTTQSYRDHIEKLRGDITRLTSAEEIRRRTGSAQMALAGQLNDEMRAELIIKQQAIRDTEARIAQLDEERANDEKLIRIKMEMADKERDVKRAKDENTIAERNSRNEIQRTISFIKGITDRQTQWAEESYAKRLSVAEKTFTSEMRLAAKKYDFEADRSEKLAKDIEADQKTREQIAAQAIQGIGAAWGDAFASMQTGAMTSGEAARQAAVQTAEVMINAAAAVAAGEAMKANSGIPIIGVALGIAAASVVVSLIKAQLSNIPKAAGGGLVTGGTPGKDSVLVNTMPGELILPVDVSKRIMEVASQSPNGGSSGFTGFASGGVVGHPAMIGGPLSVTINNRWSSLQIPTELDKKRIGRQMAKTWRRAINAGQLPQLGKA